MEIHPLNKIAIDEAIAAIKKVDYTICTIKEIEKLLEPLFAGYTTSAFKFNIGTYINRTRKCRKPDNIREVTFPPPESSMTGRANEQGHPIFYGSIGRSVPFFELEPAIGDTVVISTWKTTEEMLLNQIGYTKEAAANLRSARDFEQSLEFRKDMLSFGDENEIVYRFLADSFTKKIAPDQTDLYKITIPIAGKLMSGDIFNGIFYPTVKMFGNADNVALKTDFVKRSLKLVSVEFASITGRTSENFNIEILDTSTEWSPDGIIKWSGRMLGWNYTGPSNIKMTADGGEWLNKDEADRRIDPVPTTLIDINPSPLLIKFKNSYPTTVKHNGDKKASVPTEQITFRYAVHYDFEAKEKYLSFYIPNSRNAFEVAKSIANNYQQFYDLDKTLQTKMISSNKLNPELSISSDELKDIKFIHFFSESHIDINLLAQQVISGYTLRMDFGSL